MANINLVTANTVRIVGTPVIQRTIPADEAIVAGAPVRFVAATGRFTNANGTDAAEAAIWGVATRTVAAGQPVTAVRLGTLDGFDLSGLNFGAEVYLSDTDGRLADAAGTVEVVVGRVVPGTATTLGTTYDKLLEVSIA